jgi:uncharacterized membrane protein YsdA (DUF1294 family)
MDQRVPPKTRQRASSPSVRFMKLKLLALLTLCALPIYGMVIAVVRGGSWLPLAGYGVMSALAFGLYGYDKRQARNDAQRMPEKVLHGVELFGGWPGALLAQQAFRHKTRKVSYQVVFWLIVLLHELFWIDRVLLGGNVLARHFY